MPKESNNEELLQKLLHHIGEGEVDHALDLLSDDLQWEVVSTSRPAVLSKGDMKALLITMRSLFIDGKFRLFSIGMISSGQKVIVESESHGHLKSGGIYNNKYHSVFLLQDGKVRHVREYMDTAHVIEVLVPALAKLKATGGND